MSFSVYKHTNKTNGKIYIGITHQCAKRRWQKGEGYRGQVFYNAIKKYGWESFDHEILYAGLTEKEAKQLEVDLIAKYQSNVHGKGYNISPGGNWIEGNHDRIGSKNHKSQKVNVFDKDHNFIASYESQSLAAKELKIGRKGITKNCLGLSHTYKGYIFEYANKNYQKPFKYPPGKHSNHHTAKVNLLDDTGNILETFDSYLDAAAKYDCRANGIAKCCNGYLHTYLGRRWSHALQ